MNKGIFINNRYNLLSEIEDNSLVILFAGNAPRKNGDENYNFTPNRNFYYFTGINEEYHILVMSKIKNEINQVLFIKDIDLEKERWVGKSIRKEEATDVSGIDDIKYISELKPYLNKVICDRSEINLYIDFEKNQYDELPTVQNQFVKELKNIYPFISIKNVFPKITPLRLVKDVEEVNEIRKAIDITIKGVEQLMKSSKPGMKEYELEAYFDFVCKSEGTKDFAFKTIAAGGKNATILHYVDNNCVLNDNDLVLFDLGAQVNYYNADITRTFPVNGKFTERQKDVYNAVLRVNKKVIDTIKPGVKYKELNEQSRKWIAEECIKLGLIKDEKEVTKYYWHSIGHSLGLATHDVDSKERDTVFKEGMVWTVEPGIYIEEEGIGIRIEDDILVTSEGVEVLTKDMIKEVSEIEEFMNK